MLGTCKQEPISDMMVPMKHVIVGTAGHIDHGKSALVQALTGTDPDRLKEEKQRGITIDLGFAFSSGPEGLSLGFVDVPGHERFVKNMLAGVGGIDLVMLVVAADESVMPQTREHFEICRLLQIKRGLIAVTKADLVEPELREVAAIEVRELVAGSFLEGAPLVHVSSKTGGGIEALEKKLFEVAGEVDTRVTSGIFRLPVDRVFSMKGFGTVVTGTLISGSIKEDDDIEVLPSGVATRVRGLQAHGQGVKVASAGQRTAVNLQGVEVADLVRGDTLTRPGTLSASMMLDARLEVLASSPVTVKDLTRVHLHLGTSQVLARVRVLGGKGTIPPGGEALVQLRLEAPVVAVPGDRLIIRRYSPLETIGGGVVLDASPIKHKVSSTDVVEKLHALGEGDAVAAAALFVSEAGAGGINGSELRRRLGIDEEAVGHIVDTMVDEGRAHCISRKPLLLISQEITESMTQRLVRTLEEFQKSNPLREGMSKGELKEKVTGNATVEAFEWLLARLVDTDKVRVARDLVATADHQIQLTSEEAEASRFLEEAYRTAGYQPPALSEIAAERKRDPKLLERIQRLLIQEGNLVRVSGAMVFHRQTLDGLKSAIREEKKKGDPVDVAFFKALTGSTRKHAIPLLEWLDRERVTRRVGKDRILL
jgi:selenocysteine-specific elongation factor